MSEIYPSVRTSIRNSVLQALYERPGAWLSTHDLLALVDEAESSEVLARILSDMAATGRLAKGPKTQNAKGQACNTWGLSPEWRGRLAVENTWQDHTGQAAAEAPPLPAESREDEAPIPPAPGGYTLPADKLGSTNTPASPRCITQVQRATSQTAGLCDFAALQPPVGGWRPAHDDPPSLPAESCEDETPGPPDPAPAFTLWADASAALAAALNTTSMQETEILCAHLPERWLPELRLRLLALDGGADPEITLRVSTEGGGAYLTLSTHGKIAFDPGELDFLPSVGNALCQFVDALYPYGATRPTAATTTPSAPEAKP